MDTDRDFHNPAYPRKTMLLDAPSLHERICTMPEEHLLQFAKSEALAMADSSRLEGLILDEERIRTELLAGYLRIRSTSEPST